MSKMEMSKLDRSKDEIFASRGSGSEPFEFNDAVAEVFPDMLRRSIPGYAESIRAIGSLAAAFVRADTRCYDLGCSLGAASLAIQRNVSEPGCHIVAVDNAAAMVKRCREAIASESLPQGPEVTVVEADIRAIEIVQASMVVMNYTLQFLPVAYRAAMLQNIHAGMIDGGIFLLSEKVVDPDESIEALLVELHHDYKRRNAYSEMEISRKRAALENVLIPDSLDTHFGRLAEAGFRHAGVWLRHFNFVSLVAVK